jgi:hypothetical protein
MWIDSVINAILEVDRRNPGLSDKVALFKPTRLIVGINSNEVEGAWSEEKWREYGKVAKALVEPFQFDGCESEDDEWYYEMIENNGFDQVKANLDCLPNSSTWRILCDLVQEMGY